MGKKAEVILADLKRRIVVANRVAEALRSKGLGFLDLYDALPVMMAKQVKEGGQDTIRKMMSNVGEIAVALYVAEHKEKLRVPGEGVIPKLERARELYDKAWKTATWRIPVQTAGSDEFIEARELLNEAIKDAATKPSIKDLKLEIGKLTFPPTLHDLERDVHRRNAIHDVLDLINSFEAKWILDIETVQNTPPTRRSG